VEAIALIYKWKTRHAAVTRTYLTCITSVNRLLTYRTSRLYHGASVAPT